MKNLTFAMLMSAALAVMSACGGNSNNPTTQAAGTCAAGQVYSQARQACLPQNGCQANYGFYNNSCELLTSTTGAAQCTVGQTLTSYGCLPTAGCQNGQGFYSANNSCVPAIPYTNNYSNTYGTNQCAVGQVYSTQNGCIPKGNCGLNQGMSPNGVCVAATENTVYPGQTYGQVGTQPYGQAYGQAYGQVNGQCSGNMVQTASGCVYPQGPCQAGYVFDGQLCYRLQSANQYQNNQGGFLKRLRNTGFYYNYSYRYAY